MNTLKKIALNTLIVLGFIIGVPVLIAVFIVLAVVGKAITIALWLAGIGVLVWVVELFT